MEFMLTLDDFAVFKNNLDEYCNGLDDGQKPEFKNFLIRLQGGCFGLQQECLGEVCTFVQVKLSQEDLVRAITALTYVAATTKNGDADTVTSVLSRVNEVYKNTYLSD